MKFINTPFAENGAITSVPDSTQSDGTVNFNDGYGPDYEKDKHTDPDAKSIERGKLNYILNLITSEIKNYQTNGLPDYVPSDSNNGIAVAYPLCALVRFTDNSGTHIYASLKDNNTDVPSEKESWTPFGDGKITQINAGTNEVVPIGGIVTLGTASVLDAQENVQDLKPNKLMLSGAGGLLAQGDILFSPNNAFFASQTEPPGMYNQGGSTAGMSVALSPTDRRQIGVDQHYRLRFRRSSGVNPEADSSPWDTAFSQGFPQPAKEPSAPVVVITTTGQTFMAMQAYVTAGIQRFDYAQETVYADLSDATLNINLTYLTTMLPENVDCQYTLRLILTSTLSGNFVVNITGANPVYGFDGALLPPTPINVDAHQARIIDIIYTAGLEHPALVEVLNSQYGSNIKVPVLNGPGDRGFFVVSGLIQEMTAGTAVLGSTLTPAGLSSMNGPIASAPSSTIAGTWQLRGYIPPRSFAANTASDFVRIDGTLSAQLHTVLQATNEHELVRNCVYSSEAGDAIDCEVFVKGQWFPFTAHRDDSTRWGREIYANAVAGKYGDVGAYN